MPTLSQLLTDRAEADIAIGAGTLHVIYRPGAITPLLAHRMADVGQIAQSTTEQEVLDRMDALVDVLHPVLTGWDMDEEDEQGNPTGDKMPLTRETLSATGIAILSAIYNGIFIENQPDPTKAGRSRPASPATGAPANGSSSSTRASAKSPKK